MKVKIEIEIESISDMQETIQKIFDVMRKELDTFEVLSFKPTVTRLSEEE